MPKRTLLAFLVMTAAAWLADPVPADAQDGAPPQESPQAFGYRIGTIVWSPEQQPEDGSEVAPPDTTWYEAISDGELTVLARAGYGGGPRPAVLTIAGGPSLEVDDELGVLTPVWDEEPRLRPGVTIEQYDWIMTVDSLKADLRRGERDREVGGYATKHYVAEAGLWTTWEYVGEEVPFPSRIEASTSQVDLWFAEDLFFDPAAFAMPYSAALPLRSEPYGGGEWVWHQLAGEMEALGLLLRAEMTERTALKNDVEGQEWQNQDQMSATFVVDLEQMDPSGLDRSVLDLPRLSREEKTLFQSIGLLTMGLGCGDPAVLSEAEGSRLEGAFSGSREESVAGRAAFGTHADEPTFALALGRADEQGMSCLFFIGEKRPAAGEHGVADVRTALGKGGDAAVHADELLAGYMAAGEEGLFLFFPSSGELVLEESGDNAMTGSFSLTGWGFRRMQTGSERLEGLTLMGSFEAVSGLEIGQALLQ